MAEMEYKRCDRVRCLGNPEHEGEYKALRGDGRYGVWCNECDLWLRWEFPLAEFTPEMEAKVREIIRDEIQKAR